MMVCRDRPNPQTRPLRCPLVGLLLLGLIACGGKTEGVVPQTLGEQTLGEQTPGERAVAALAPDATAEERASARLSADFPLYGAVRGTLKTVHAEPSGQAPTIGWLRVGSQIRLGSAARRGKGCRGAFRPVYAKGLRHRKSPAHGRGPAHRKGWICVDDDLLVAEAVPQVEPPTDQGWKDGQVEAAQKAGRWVLPHPARDAPLPYEYFYVKELMVPEYHRLPSRNEQRAALARTKHFLHLLERDEKRAMRFRRGQSDEGPRGTAVTHRYLDRGFFVASNGSETRAFRRFVRTTQGRYIKKAQLEKRALYPFVGVELTGGLSLPVAWTVRNARPLRKVTRDDGTERLVLDPESAPLPRQLRLSDWAGQESIAGRAYQKLMTEAGPRYLRPWFVAVAERVTPPFRVSEDEPWIHIDRGQQTLSVYRGRKPVYATLVSTGVEGHETPLGVFRIRRKHVTDTMANIGPDAGDDRYRIEDVPWTQYFEGSIAVHAAFWHTRFGLPRSHGCVNLSPRDAHWVFHATWPTLPEGWHGIATEGSRGGEGPRGSRVWISDGPPAPDAAPAGRTSSASST